MTPNQPAAATGLSEGMKLGGCYVLRENLTRAGGPTIWRASDEVLGKDVTLHFIPEAVLSDSQAVAELRQDVKRNRQLIHPNILRVYDFVEDGNCVAISMDRFDGESLAEVLKRAGRLDPEDVKPWVVQLADTLGDAHRIQLFHRDLSPSNLYLRPTGGLLVTNFGFSRANLNALERKGLISGNDAHMSYLSPQQLDGERPGASDDIYGFGVLLYEVLTGQAPFTGDDLVPKIRKSVPAPVAEARAASGATAAIPASWEKVIAACMAKSPELRPRNFTEVASMLAQDSGVARTAAAAAPRAAAVESKRTAPARQEVPAAPREDAFQFTPPAAHRTAPEAVEKTNGRREELDREMVRETGSWKPPGKANVASKSGDRPEPPPPVPKPGMKKGPAKGVLSANYPDLDRPRSKAPLVWLLLVASLIGVGIYFKNKPDASEEDTEGAISQIDNLPEDGGKPPGPDPVAPTATAGPKETVSLPDPTPVKPEPQPEPAHVAATRPMTPKVGGELISSEPTPPPGVLPPELTPDSLASLAANPPDGRAPKPAPSTPVPKPPAAVTPKQAEPPPMPPEPIVSPPAPSRTATLPEPPAALPSLALPKNATLAQLEEAKKARTAAIEPIRKAAAAAAAVQQDNAKKLDTAKAGFARLQEDYEARRKTLAPVIQQAAGIEAERKKLEESVMKAEAAATEAANAAAASKRALEDAVAKGGEKLKAMQKAEAELSAASAEVAGRTKEIEQLARLISKADALQQQLQTAQEAAEQDLQKIAASIDKARRGDTEQQQKAHREKIATLEKQLQALQADAARLNAALVPLKELGEVGKDASKKIEEKLASTNQQIRDLEIEIKRAPAAEPSLPVAAPKAAAPPEPATPAATSGSSGTNSLGMQFVPVGNVQFAVYLTTRKDFEAFARATSLKSQAWQSPGFKQEPDHPVVNVTWREADSFCKWLTEKERKSGQLKSGESYRLPTDIEWSKAVGLPPETGSTPEERDMGVQDVYPWGTQWPPPAGAGNFAGEETQTEIPIPNYNDGYANTSPVGKFRPNALGLCDMGGNVWQWVSDYWNAENRAKTLRGGSWYNGAIPLSLLSSCRISSSPDTLHDTYGFRIVKATDSAKGRKRP